MRQDCCDDCYDLMRRFHVNLNLERPQAVLAQFRYYKSLTVHMSSELVGTTSSTNPAVLPDELRFLKRLLQV